MLENFIKNFQYFLVFFYEIKYFGTKKLSNDNEISKEDLQKYGLSNNIIIIKQKFI